jgi:hypothetical protein
MRLISATTKRMKSIIHDQQLQGMPGCLQRHKGIRIINLTRKISDNPFNEAIGPGHPGVNGKERGRVESWRSG